MATARKVNKYYIADTHLGHEKILELSNRPFKNVEEMDRKIIDNWNNIVGETDKIYIIGDIFCRMDQKKIEEYLKQLQGRKILIEGNHDRKWLGNRRLQAYFESIHQYVEIDEKLGMNIYKVILFHYPIIEWEQYFRKSYHIFGHIHNNKHKPQIDYIRQHPRMLNAGVDVNNYRPVTLKELIENNNKFYEKTI